MVKPCKKCGSTDRYKGGNCKPCAKVWHAARYASIQDKQTLSKPCKKCFGTEKTKNGSCLPCRRKAAQRYAQTDAGKLVRKLGRERRKEEYKHKQKKWDREKALKKFYSMTPQDYDLMFTKQNGCCAICGIHQAQVKRTLSVDHCHHTGKIRGLLCDRCNHGLGHFNDSIFTIGAAIEYLLVNAILPGHIK